MKLNSFAVPYITDDRIIYAKEYLINKGYEFKENVDEADFVVLPIPVKKYMLENLDNKIVFYGMGDYRGFDYNKVNSFLLENAFLTAEGAVALLKQTSAKAIYNSKILITGYGRIGEALHHILSSMGASITVCSRSSESKSKAKFNGAKTMNFQDLVNPNKFDFIFNTVPHIIFTKNELDAVKNDAYLFDLASFPGGVDTLYAKSKHIKLIDGKRLPSKFSKESAGYLIGKTINQIIKEELT